ncbi:hypothetical protein SmJEL517_g01414 [Synchytrium microbalum]|uniref:RRM domain-containing protein n=1 Tax=Synchytrium microbalum TaxID=1806994 RepID=A0A507CE05_9FUNG|nr:uncharacterized protein SmJEL517_g01414 [Synchytrium microbalum]TPX36154.1 hypothetical protein SmJEL517_g01414 [Synchytrium microbalum]
MHAYILGCSSYEGVHQDHGSQQQQPQHQHQQSQQRVLDPSQYFQIVVDEVAGSSSLLFEHLEPNTTRAQIHNIFGQFGNIKSAKMFMGLDNRPSIFIVFDQLDSAQAAHSQATKSGNDIRCYWVHGPISDDGIHQTIYDTKDNKWLCFSPSCMVTKRIGSHKNQLVIMHVPLESLDLVDGDRVVLDQLTTIAAIPTINLHNADDPIRYPPAAVTLNRPVPSTQPNTIAYIHSYQYQQQQIQQRAPLPPTDTSMDTLAELASILAENLHNSTSAERLKRKLNDPEAYETPFEVFNDDDILLRFYIVKDLETRVIKKAVCRNCLKVWKKMHIGLIRKHLLRVEHVECLEGRMCKSDDECQDALRIDSQKYDLPAAMIEAASTTTQAIARSPSPRSGEDTPMETPTTYWWIDSDNSIPLSATPSTSSSAAYHVLRDNGGGGASSSTAVGSTATFKKPPYIAGSYLELLAGGPTFYAPLLEVIDVLKTVFEEHLPGALGNLTLQLLTTTPTTKNVPDLVSLFFYMAQNMCDEWMKPQHIPFTNLTNEQLTAMRKTAHMVGTEGILILLQTTLEHFRIFAQMSQILQIFQTGEELFDFFYAVPMGFQRLKPVQIDRNDPVLFPNNEQPSTPKKIPANKPTPIRKSEVLKYVCEVCSRVFKKKFNWQEHKITHQNDESKKHSCDSCGRKFKRIPDLERHRKVLHSDTQTVFECEKCHKTFSRKDNFKRHQNKIACKSKYDGEEDYKEY